jgi:hypothetical protein
MSDRVVKHVETQYHEYVTPKSPCWTRSEIDLTLKNAMTFVKCPRQRFRTQSVVKSFLATCAANAHMNGHHIVQYRQHWTLKCFIDKHAKMTSMWKRLYEIESPTLLKYKNIDTVPPNLPVVQDLICIRL